MDSLKAHGEVATLLVELLDHRCEDVLQQLALAPLTDVPRIQGEYAGYVKLKQALLRQPLPVDITE